MPLGMEIGTRTPTQFLAHVYCGQTAGCMKTPLGVEVDLVTGHVVPAVRERCTAASPLFSPMSIVQKTNQNELLLSVITSNTQSQGNRYKQLGLHSECTAMRTNTSHIAQCGNTFSIKNTFKDIEYFFSRNVFRLWL